jgi:hypothetical protein
MYSVRISVGRVLELTVASPFESTDFRPFQTLVRDAIQSAPSKVIACSDLRRATVFTQDIVTGMVDLMRSDNPKIERSGFLIAGSAVFTMQMERIIRGANNPARRTFRNSVECVSWLSEVLNPAERRQLQQFVWG